MSERPYPSQILDIEVTPFVRHVDESSYKVFGGDYLPRLQDARETAFDELGEILGVSKVPESYLRQYYTRTIEERETSRRFHDTLQRKFTAKAMRDKLLESPLKLSDSPAAKQFGTNGISLVNHIVPHMIGYVQNVMVESVQPLSDDQLTIKTGLAQVPNYINNDYGESSSDCAMHVLATNIAHLVDSPLDNCRITDQSAFNGLIVERQEPLIRHDLPRLLGTLATSHAQTKLDTTVRVRTSVGAPLSDIEQLYIAPLRERLPQAEFILNTILTSDTIPAANHAATILSANGEKITLTDPKHGVIKLTNQEFLRRWAPTNMQTSLVVAIPRTQQLP